MHPADRSASPGRRARRPWRRRGAFTVVEATVAMAIVTVVLSSLFVLHSDMLRLLSASMETTNASAHLQIRVEQVRLANWTQLTDPDWIQGSLLKNPTDADVNLAGLSETCTVSAYQSPSSPVPANATPPPFTVTRQADGTTSVDPPGYAGSARLGRQEMLQIDLSVTWPSLGRTRTRAQSTLVSPWGVSK